MESLGTRNVVKKYEKKFSKKREDENVIEGSFEENNNNDKDLKNK